MKSFKSQVLLVYSLVLLTALASLGFSSLARAEQDGDRSSAWLFEEPLAQSRDPHFFDWWQRRLEVEAGVTLIDEANSFRSHAFSLGVVYGISPSVSLRGIYRKVFVSGTGSTDLLSQTPFSQAAQASRTELAAGILFPLLAGRSFTRLSPWIADVDHVLSAVLNIHYSFYPSWSHLTGGPAPDPLPGQRVINYRFAGEIGLQFKVGLPHALSVLAEWTYLRPAARDPDLPSWTSLTGGLSWAF